MAIQKDKRIARPYIVLYKRNTRWYVYAARDETEADAKATKLLTQRRTLAAIVAKVIYEATATLPPADVSQTD